MILRPIKIMGLCPFKIVGLCPSKPEQKSCFQAPFFSGPTSQAPAAPHPIHHHPWVVASTRSDLWFHVMVQFKKLGNLCRNCEQKCSHTNVLLVFFSFSQTWDPQQHDDNQIILENFGTSKLLLFQHWHGSWALTSQIMLLADIQSWWSSLSAKQLKAQCISYSHFLSFVAEMLVQTSLIGA